VILSNYVPFVIGEVVSTASRHTERLECRPEVLKKRTLPAPHALLLRALKKQLIRASLILLNPQRDDCCISAPLVSEMPRKFMRRAPMTNIITGYLRAIGGRRNNGAIAWPQQKIDGMLTVTV